MVNDDFFFFSEFQSLEGEMWTEIKKGIPKKCGTGFIYLPGAPISEESIIKEVLICHPNVVESVLEKTNHRCLKIPCEQAKQYIEEIDEKKEYFGRIHERPPEVLLKWYRMRIKYTHWLKRCQKRNPEVYDRAASFASFLFSLVMLAAPFLSLETVFRVMGELVFFVLFLMARDAKAEKKLDVVNKSLDERCKHQESLLRLEFFEKEKKWSDNIESVKRQYKNNIQFIKDIAHRAKSEALFPMEQNRNFLDFCASTLESILGDEYGKDICASIKVVGTNSNNTICVKTYGAGKNNVAENRFSATKEVLLEENFAYKWIRDEGKKFFACDDLSKRNDFFCEYDKIPCGGSQSGRPFMSTVVMPIRRPIHRPGEKQENNIVGFICIDCKDTLPAWEKDFYNTAQYNIIADVADNLVQVFDKGVA